MSKLWWNLYELKRLTNRVESLWAALPMLVNKDETMARVRTVKRQLEREINRYGSDFAAFKADWTYLRVFIPLQVRLCAEQLLYEKGQPWASLVTGFRPVDVGGTGGNSQGVAQTSGIPGGSKGGRAVYTAREKALIERYKRYGGRGLKEALGRR